MGPWETPTQSHRKEAGWGGREDKNQQLPQVGTGGGEALSVPGRWGPGVWQLASSESSASASPSTATGSQGVLSNPRSSMLRPYFQDHLLPKVAWVMKSQTVPSSLGALNAAPR